MPGVISFGPCQPFATALAQAVWQVPLVGIVAASAAGCCQHCSSRVRHGIFLVAMLLAGAILPLNVLLTFDHESARALVGLSDEFLPGDEAESEADYGSAAPSTGPNSVDSAILTPGPGDGIEESTGSAGRERLKAGGGAWMALPGVWLDWWSSKTWQWMAPIVTVAYLIGVFSMILRLAVGSGGAYRLRRRSATIDDTALVAVIQRVAARLGLAITPVVASSKRVAGPVLVGVLRPVILLPASLVSGLTSDEFEAILAHEMAHIRRYDHIALVLQRLVEAMLFFHPVVWYLSRHLSVERELCCDDVVLATGGDAVVYSNSLLRVAQWRLLGNARGVGDAATLAASGHNVSRLRQRIGRMLGVPVSDKRHITPKGSLAVTAILIATLSGPMFYRLWAAPQTARATQDKKASRAREQGPVRNGVDAALSEFDSQFSTALRWQSTNSMFRVSFRDARWIDALGWFAERTGRSLDMAELPSGTFSYSETRFLDRKELTRLFSREAWIAGYLLLFSDDDSSLTVVSAKKQISHSAEQIVGKRSGRLFEVTAFRWQEKLARPVPSTPSIVIQLTALKDIPAKRAADYVQAEHQAGRFYRLPGTEARLGIAGGCSVWQRGSNYVTGAPSMKKGDSIEVWISARTFLTGLYRGQEAEQRVKRFAPRWGESQHGIQIGLLRPSDETEYRLGQRMPLDLCVRNVGNVKTRVEFPATFYGPGRTPNVHDAAGEEEAVESIQLRGATSLVREELKPGEVFVYRHSGVGFGERPPHLKTMWYPFLKRVSPGKYSVHQRVQMRVESSQEGGHSVDLVTGTLEFQFALPSTASSKSAELGNALKAALATEQAAAKHDSGSERSVQLLTDAAAAFHEIYRRHRTRLGGLYARMYEARCYRSLGKTKQAISICEELLAHELDTEALARFQLAVKQLRASM